MKNKLVDLRNHLFETLEALKDKDAPMEIERAKTIGEVAQVIINSAKVEADFIKMSGGDTKGSGFIGIEEKEINPEAPGAPRLVKGTAQSGSK